MTSFNVFGFYHDDPDGNHDERRNRIPQERLHHVADWFAFHRFDAVLIERSDQPAFSPSVIHHICADSHCPGGCGYD
jgi:hypothetical protein